MYIFGIIMIILQLRILLNQYRIDSNIKENDKRYHDDLYKDGIFNRIISFIWWLPGNIYDYIKWCIRKHNTNKFKKESK